MKWFKNKKVVKLCFTLLVVFILSSNLLFAGAEKEEASSEKVTITFLGWWNDEYGKDVMQEIADSFMEKNPNVNVKMMDTPHGAFEDKLLALSQAGETPDVMGMEFNWVPRFDKMGILADISPLIEKEGSYWTDRYNPGWTGYYGGRAVIQWLYAMSYGPVYNEGKFEELGIAVPTDWDELEVALQKYKEATGKYGMAVPLAKDSFAHFLLYSYFTRLIQAGGELMSKDGKAVFNSPAGVKALEYWKNLADKDLIYPDALALSDPMTIELLASEEIGLLMTGPFIGPVVKNRNADMKLSYTPAFEDVTGGFVSSGSGISLFKDSENPEIAWEFFKHLISDEVAEKMTNEVNSTWANMNAFSSELYETDPLLKQIPVMLSRPGGQPLPFLPELGDLINSFGENVQAYWLGQKTAQEALDDAVAYWNEVIESYK
ncbi:MAG: sugar ABC transporter substrate-binding protein [Bacteroidetes bacterium]|nr:sugar ABC transporter substrate-binding protein [Bacteroidota bacterium]